MEDKAEKYADPHLQGILARIAKDIVEECGRDAPSEDRFRGLADQMEMVLGERLSEPEPASVSCPHCGSPVKLSK